MVTTLNVNLDRPDA